MTKLKYNFYEINIYSENKDFISNSAKDNCREKTFINN